MRKAYSNQLRLDTVPIRNVELNLQCRDRIVPVLRALQGVYADSKRSGSSESLAGRFAWFVVVLCMACPCARVGPLKW